MRFVWPVHNWDIMTCSFLDFLKAGLHFPKVGFIWKSLLLMLFQRCCHFVRKNLLIWGFKSVYRIEILTGLRSKANLAVKPVFHFYLLWCGLGSNTIISLWLDIESSLLSSLTINGFSSFLFLSDVNTENESENNKFMFVLRNDVESKVNGTYFCSDDGDFHWKGFLVNGFIKNSDTHCLIAILGAIHKYILISGWCKRIVWNFFQFSAWMCFCFGEFV